MNKNFYDFILKASMNPVLGIEFLLATNNIEELKALFQETGITDLPDDQDCQKLLDAKKNLLANIDNITKMTATADRTKY